MFVTLKRLIQAYSRLSNRSTSQRHLCSCSTTLVAVPQSRRTVYMALQAFLVQPSQYGPSFDSLGLAARQDYIGR
jgi:hypothetical protein